MRERERVKPAKGEWPYVVLGVFLFFGSIFLFVAEVDNFTFTTRLNLFLIVFGLIGLALAIGLSLYYGKGTKGVERARLTLLFVIFITLIVPVWGHFINRMIVLTSREETVQVFENSLEDLTLNPKLIENALETGFDLFLVHQKRLIKVTSKRAEHLTMKNGDHIDICLLYTSPSPRDQRGSRMPSSA